MSRNHRRGRARSAPLSSAPALQELSLTPSAFGGFGPSGYQGAQWSPDRGMIYWPTLNAQREIDSYSRTEIARKIHALCANFGLPRRILGGLTNLIVGSGLRPQARTKDAEWNELAEQAYNMRAASGLTYSVNGRLTGVQMQRLATMTRLKDGDAGVVFSESASGGALRKLYSGLQVANAGTPPDTEKWIDGLRLDSLERVMTYRFPGENGEPFIDVPAAYMRWLVRYESPGQIRGISALAHAVNRIIDIGEIHRYVTQGIKTSQQIGYYLGQAAGEKNQAVGIKAAMEGRTLALQNPDGTTTRVNLNFGNGGAVPTLPPGVDIKTLLDERPHQNQRDFVDESLIRDICAGVSSVSSDLLWNIYKLGGANVRYVMADAQVFVAIEQQDLVDSWLTQDWIYTIAKEMKAGRLRECTDPLWWLHGWVPPARVTVDFGRDGAIYLRWYQAGLITCERLYAMSGQDAREELKQELELIAWHKKEMSDLSLTWQDVRDFRGVLGGTAPAVTAEDLQAQQDLENAVAGEDQQQKAA